MHTLVDVGAGTMDVTTFNVHNDKEGDDLFAIFTRGVEPLGTRYLIQHRLEESRTLSWNPPPFEDVPQDDIFEKKLGLHSGGLQKLDGPFRDRVAKLMWDKMNDTKKERHPLAPAWVAGVPTFVCGGGARVNLYSSVFSGFEASGPPFKITTKSLTVPEDLKLPERWKPIYDRLSVAYGLSFGPDNIGTILRMQHIENVPQPQPGNIRDRYVGKEMV